MTIAMVEVAERRRYGRVTPVEKIRGTAGEVVVYILDLSVNGFRIAHQERLPDVGEPLLLKFEWQARRFKAQCEVVRTTVEKRPRSQFDKPLYHSGLAIVSKDANSGQTLRDLIADCVARALDEQKANAQGKPAIAAQSVQTGKGAGEFMRCELRANGWVKTKTQSSDQPENGFTVSAEETPQKIDMLCKAYESGDADGRRLIRTFSALSVSKSEGIPTRRYAP